LRRSLHGRGDHWHLLFARVVGAASGAIVRMLSEERLLIARYPEYRDYIAGVSRIVPFVY